MSHQGPPHESHGNERQPSPISDHGFMEFNPVVQSTHPPTIPFGSIPQSSLPKPTEVPAVFASWGATPYPMPHGMQQGHPQYPQYASHPGAPQFVAQQEHPYAAPAGMSPGQPPYAPPPGQYQLPGMNHQAQMHQAQMHQGHMHQGQMHQAQMYPYPYQHHGQQMHQYHMQPEQQVQHEPEIAHQTKYHAPSRASPPPTMAGVKQSTQHIASRSAAHSSMDQNAAPHAQDFSDAPSPSEKRPASPSNHDRSDQLRLAAEDDEPVKNDELYQFALKLVGPKTKKAVSGLEKEKPSQENANEAQGHPFFTSRSKSPDPLSYKVTPLTPRTIGGLHDQLYANYTPSCQCRRPVGRGMDSTRDNAHICLKLYCECFAFGALCTERCGCSSACFNNAEHRVERARAVGSILQEDPSGFRRNMDWMSDIQRNCRNDYIVPKEKKMISTVNKLDHEDITDDSLRIAKLPPNRYTVDLRGNNGVVYRALAFSLTHPKLHRRRKKCKVSPAYSTSKERIGYPELELVANMECKKADELLKNALSQVDAVANDASALTQQDPCASVDRLLAVNVAQELINARRTALSVKDFMSTTYFDGPKLKRKATEATDYRLDEQINTAADSRLVCTELLARLDSNDLQDQEVKDLILSVSEDTAIIQHTACAIRRIARKIARRRTS